MSKTIGLEPVKNFTKYSIYSGFVENAPRPLSILVLAHPERGKSTEVQKWYGLGVINLQDMTSYGVDRQIHEMSGRDVDIFHHMTIADLEKLSARNSARARTEHEHFPKPSQPSPHTRGSNISRCDPKKRRGDVERFMFVF